MELPIKKPDMVCIALIALIVVLGLVMLSSASVVLGQTRFNDPYVFFKKQLVLGVIPGLILCYGLTLFDYRLLEKIAIPLFVANLFLMMLVFVPGIGLAHGGARRWVGVGPLSFQPSELLKLTFIIYLSAWLKRKKVSGGITTLPFLSLLGVIAVLVLAQPDVGTLGVLLVISFGMYFAAGASIKDLGKIGAISIILLLVIVVIAPYRLNRLKVFFDPTTDPLGSSYQINQSILAIGSGGLTGLGIGHSRQKFNYLPEVSGDAIFAIIAEELGFIMGIGFIALFVALASKGLTIAHHASDEFGYLIACGLSLWVLAQTLINISAAAGLIPFTGVPLPFVSYGGTAMLIGLSGMGILISISRYGSTQQRLP